MDPTIKPVYEFGQFRLDPAEQLLLCGGQPVSVTPRAFDLLVYLVEHHGRLVEKQTLLSAVWPDAIVEEGNLPYNISALRKALGDGREDSRFIETVPTRGYRFVAPVTTIPDFDARKKAVTTRRWRLAAAASAVLGSLATLWYAGPASKFLSPVPDGSIAAPRLVRITSLPGMADQPSFSPDGESVAFSWQREPNRSRNLYQTIVGRPEVRQLTSGEDYDLNPAWSPDGRQVAFIRATSSRAQVWIVSAIGGSPRKVSELPVDGRLTWSADSRTIVAGADGSSKDGRSIYAIPVDGGDPRLLIAAPPPGGATGPVMAPDGRRMAYISCRNVSGYGLLGCEIDIVSIDVTATVVATPNRIAAIPTLGWLMWTRDGQSILFFGDTGDGHGGVFRVWLNGDRKWDRVDSFGPGACSPVMAWSKDRLVFARYNIDVDVFATHVRNPPAPLLSSSANDVQPTYSPDGRLLAFVSDRTDVPEVWVSKVDGSEARQVTRGPNHWQWSPRWSPDGRQIAFQSREQNGDWHIWTIGVDGGTPHQLTFGAGEQTGPTWSRDGRWIYFSDRQGDQYDIWRIPSNGGAPTRITTEGSGFAAVESPDGRSLIYHTKTADSPLVMRALDSGKSREIVRCAAIEAFAVNAHGLYYLPCANDYGNAQVHLLGLVSGKDQVVATLDHLDFGTLTDLPVSPDGATFLYTRLVNEDRAADLWMIENFK